MKNTKDFFLKSPGYFVKRLTRKDTHLLQGLYDRCAEFFILTDGLAPSPTAADEEFDDVPEGKTAEDVYIFGLFDSRNNLLGEISAVRHYPDVQTWWIGLMMLDPEYRGQGLGADFFRGFEHWVSAQGISQISLVAIEANETGLQFWKRMGFEAIRKTPPRQYKAKTHAVYVLSRAIIMPESSVNS
ncbi:MAG: GNAT family N-acetyltransferase [Geitlerinemataceae cyanobacterium]